MKVKFLIMQGLILVAGAQALAGGIAGGGGRSIVCGSADGSIKSAEMLDLFEGREQFGWNAVSDNRDFKTQALDAAAKLSQAYDDSETRIDWPARVEQTLKAFKFVNSRLLAVDDSMEVIAPRGCATEQVANNLGYTILVDRTIFDAMSETSKAALLLHETIYEVFRYYGETNSIRARRAVALAFSGHRFESFFTDLPSYYVKCSTRAQPLTNAPEILFYADTNGDIHARIMRLGKYLQLVKNDIVIAKTKDPQSEAWADAEFPLHIGFALNDTMDIGLARPILESMRRTEESPARHRYLLALQGFEPEEKNHTVEMRYSSPNILSCEPNDNRAKIGDWRRSTVIQTIWSGQWGETLD